MDGLAFGRVDFDAARAGCGEDLAGRHCEGEDVGWVCGWEGVRLQVLLRLQITSVMAAAWRVRSYPYHRAFDRPRTSIERCALRGSCGSGMDYGARSSSLHGDDALSHAQPDYALASRFGISTAIYTPTASVAEHLGMVLNLG